MATMTVHKSIYKRLLNENYAIIRWGDPEDEVVFNREGEQGSVRTVRVGCTGEEKFLNCTLSSKVFTSCKGYPIHNIYVE